MTLPEAWLLPKWLEWMRCNPSLDAQLLAASSRLKGMAAGQIHLPTLLPVALQESSVFGVNVEFFPFLWRMASAEQRNVLLNL